MAAIVQNTKVYDEAIVWTFYKFYYFDLEYANIGKNGGKNIF
jgi:hypothetical protein